MYFTKSKNLNRFERMMKRTPDIGSKRIEEDMPARTHCMNRDLAFQKKLSKYGSNKWT